MSDIATGWNRDAEDMGFLKEAFKAKVPQAFKSFARPEEVRPDLNGGHRIENQGAMGSCQGFTIASCVEWLNFIATGGDKTQLSSLFAYIATQQIDGLIGRDQGSTISGGIKLATTTGICPEALCPYPELRSVRYPNANERRSILSKANATAAEPFKARSAVGIRSHQDALEWIGGGGGVSIGIAWPPGIVKQGNRYVVNQFNPGRQGGHAISVLGYLKDGTLIFCNSHGYYFYVSPSVFEQMLRHRYTVCGGVSDMATPKPRDFSFKDGKLAAWLKKAREEQGTPL